MFNAEKQIFDEFGLKIQMAGEVEFYVEPKPQAKSEQENTFLALLYKNLLDEIGQITKIDYEAAEGMYEVAFIPKSPKDAAEDIRQFPDILHKTCSTLGFKPIYEPKPYNNLPGCGMHIHIGIIDEKGQGKLQRISEYQECEIMENIIGGLCVTMLKNFTIFAPYEKSYARFNSKFNHEEAKKLSVAAINNAPVNISWGGNNRTTALRIPTSTIDESTRHIEHRVSGVDADPNLVIKSILEGVYIGLKEKPVPPEKIYGNAFDSQYNFLQPLPKTLSEAKKIKNSYKN